ncbi:MAG: transaldolase [Chromatiales bacterium]|jgi:transaldolase
MGERNPLQQLSELGQSIWYDYIRRDLMADGELTRLIEMDDLRGMTSNPTIFDKAISETSLYDQTILETLQSAPNLDATELFYRLAIEDIRLAADAFLAVYDETRGRDGYVSLEVSPRLARDTEATVVEAHSLYERVRRPNLMIKVPATIEGLPAIETLIADGVNVNVTLLFSVQRYQAVLEAYLRGLERRVEAGLPIDRIASVASFFVSRVDTTIDKQLTERGGDANALLGKSAIANAKLAYGHFQQVTSSERFQRLVSAGAQPQRLLWASTGTKNPAYSDVLYVESLVGPDTVNTLPPATYEAFRDHGRALGALGDGLVEAQALIDSLPQHGVDLDAVTDRLEVDGVQAFADSFQHLIDGLDAKRRQLAA